MTKYNYLIIILLILFCNSCTNNIKNNLNTINLTESSDNKIVCSDVIEVLDWILLDSSVNYLSSGFTKIEYYKEKYYLLDNYDNKSILVFDKEGKGIQKIGHIGGGPGEYSEITDFAINYHNGDIAILTTPCEIFNYDNDGKFKNSVSLDNTYIWSISSSNNGFLASSEHMTFTEGDNAFLLYDFNSDFSLRNKDIRVLPMQMTSMRYISNPFNSVNNCIYYCDEFCNCIYCYKDFKFTKIYDLTFANPCNPKYRKDFNTANQYLHQTDFLMNYLVSNDRMLFIYVKQGPIYISLFDLNENKILFNKVLDDIHFPCVSSYIGNDEFISLISIEDYLEYWKSTDAKKANFYVSENDNMLIMKWKLK